MNKVSMIGLGCPKNQVDAEVMLSSLLKAGFELTPDLEEAEAVIINTCGFIDSAKKEAIDTILSVAEMKGESNIKALVVTGCLAERYKEEIIAEFPEVDACIGIGANGKIAEVIEKALKGEKVSAFPSKYDLALDGDRVLTTPPHYAYLKIAEGCSNCCTYCAIPKIRGKFRSRSMESILEEARSLVESGVKELIVVAQDTTKYGIDLYGELKLSELLRKLCRINGIEWIRILYCYPESVTDELIKTIAEEEKICKYIDLPLQHASESVLKRMNRHGSKEELLSLVEKLKAEIPSLTLRTTFITGFPGESEEDFEELCDFIEKAEFDRLGCFAYSPEEGTFAAKMENQIDDEIKEKRSEIIMNSQQFIMDKKQKEMVGKTFEVIVDGFDEENLFYFGRAYTDAPEIDTMIIISSEEELSSGQFVNCRIIGTDDCDLVGEVIL